MWWLSLDGKLNLPFNEPDALLFGMQAPLFGMQAPLFGMQAPHEAPGGKLEPRGGFSRRGVCSLSRAGLLALEPRMLLLAAAGCYETTGRTAGDLECLAAWLARAMELEQARFVPIQQRRRNLLRTVQQRRESYLRHLRRQSDPVELQRQLRRLLRDCGQYPGKWRASRLLRRWISPELLDQLAELQVSQILQPIFWPEHSHATNGADWSAGRARGDEAPADAERDSQCAKLASDVPAGISPDGGAPTPAEQTLANSAAVEREDGPAAAVTGLRGPAIERWLQAEKLAALRQLAYGASHEINNPLANIAMRAEMLLRGEGDADRLRKLQVIRQQALRAHEMISDLMLFANPPRPNLEEIELAEFLQQIAVELQPDVALAGGTLELAKTPTGCVVVDPGQLAELVRALVRNALEAQPTGARVTIRGEVTPAGVAAVEVLDDGPGIGAEVARHMFDPFFSSREAGRGLGFGLSKAWRIAESHGGQLACLDRTAGSTRFRFQWPRLECPAKAA